MVSEKWKTVQLPSGLLEEIEKYLTSEKNFGYTSKSKFISEAIRRLLEHYEK